MQIPARQGNALTGSQFVKQLTDAPGADREKAILKQIVSGNIPDYLRQLVPITVGKEKKITYYVMPDYLSIGSDEDYIRMPMQPATAQAIANYFHATLPTAQMVDQIYEKAAQKINMVAKTNTNYKPGTKYSFMESTGHFAQHSTETDKNIDREKGGLVAGHKKDVIIGNKGKNKVLIYGARINNKNLQGYSDIHHDQYVDYSHGIRLIDQVAILEENNKKTNINILEALKNPALASILNGNRGVIPNVAYDTKGLEAELPQKDNIELDPNARQNIMSSVITDIESGLSGLI